MKSIFVLFILSLQIVAILTTQLMDVRTVEYTVTHVHGEVLNHDDGLDEHGDNFDILAHGHVHQHSESEAPHTHTHHHSASQAQLYMPVTSVISLNIADINTSNFSSGKESGFVSPYLDAVFRPPIA